MSEREIKEKNILMVYLLSIFTFGVYPIVWYVKSKRDMNSLGAQIPTSWLLIVPVANFYWIYKYCEGFSNHLIKDDNTVLWFCVSLFAGFLMPYFVQNELNKHASHSQPSEASNPEPVNHAA